MNCKTPHFGREGMMCRENLQSGATVPHETSGPIASKETISAPAEQQSTPPPPEGPRASNGWRIGKRKNNGGFRPGAGCPKGVEKVSKRKYDPAGLAQVVAEKIVTGKMPKTHPATGPLTVETRQILSRVANETVDAFNERIALELRDVADLATQRIKEKLLNDEFKTSELGFILSVAQDKRLTLDGSRALTQSAINMTVNNFGPIPKEQLLADLDGLSHTKNVTNSAPP